MEVKSFVVAGLVAATVSPVMASKPMPLTIGVHGGWQSELDSLELQKHSMKHAFPIRKWMRRPKKC